MGPRTRNICIILLILTLAGATGCAVLYKIIKNNVALSYLTEADIQSEADRQRQKIVLKSFFNESGSDVSRLSKSIIARDGTVPFIEYLESVARTSGVSFNIDSVNIASAGKKVNDVENLQIVVTSQGSWVNVYTFLEMLETLPYKSLIQSANFSRNLKIWRSTVALSVLKIK